MEQDFKSVTGIMLYFSFIIKNLSNVRINYSGHEWNIILKGPLKSPVAFAKCLLYCNIERRCFN
jgi:hypothetical protein